MSCIAIIKNTDYPEYLCCPINHKLMVEPVIMSDGHSYDKDNIMIIKLTMHNYRKFTSLSKLTYNRRQIIERFIEESLIRY